MSDTVAERTVTTPAQIWAELATLMADGLPAPESISARETFSSGDPYLLKVVTATVADAREWALALAIGPVAVMNDGEPNGNGDIWHRSQRFSHESLDGNLLGIRCIEVHCWVKPEPVVEPEPAAPPTIGVEPVTDDGDINAWWLSKYGVRFPRRDAVVYRHDGRLAVLSATGTVEELDAVARRCARSYRAEHVEPLVTADGA